jgi:phenylalanyl-tRNA synthetase beta chain
VVFELSLKSLPRVSLPLVVPPVRFPGVRRDIAVLVDEAVEWQAIRSAIAECGLQTLESVWLFDIYRGQGIESGKKSLAIGMSIRDTLKTLTDAEIDAVVTAVVEHLGSRTGATLRQ